MLGPRHVATGAAAAVLWVQLRHLVAGFALALSAFRLPLTHDLLPHALAIVLAEVLAAAGAVVFGGLGALLPDMDSPSSTLGKLLPSWWHRLTPGHRGIAHTFYATAVWYSGAWLFFFAGGSTSPVAPESMVVGHLAHLAGDAVTIDGIHPFLLPKAIEDAIASFLPRRLRRAFRALVHLRVQSPLPFKTGGPVEPWVAYPATAVLIGLAVALAVGLPQIVTAAQGPWA